MDEVMVEGVIVNIMEVGLLIGLGIIHHGKSLKYYHNW